MADSTKSVSVLGDIASLIGAVAWPAVTAAFLWRYRERVGRLFEVLILKVERAKTIKAAGIELAEEEIAQALAAVVPEPEAREVPQAQVKDAQVLAVSLGKAGVSRAEASVSAKSKWQMLAQEYGDVRESMEPGAQRTETLDRIVAQMRTLGLLVRPFLQNLSRSESAGERLVAIASLQVVPDESYAEWLAQRMGTETPFVFYHAALALRQLIAEKKFTSANEMKALLTSSIETVESYPGGRPDESTLFLLRDAVNRLGWQP